MLLARAVRSRAVPRLVDTTIRLLSQEPLAGALPTAEILRVAEILDEAGFACLEVSGGGVFDATVRRRVETPWERIRAIKARVSTPLGIALRGRFLVGSQPVERRHRRPVRLLRGRERDRGLPAPRPAERRLEPPRGGSCDHDAGRRLPRGSRLQPRAHGRDRHARRAGAQAPDLGATPRHRQRPDGRALPAPRAGARRADQGGERAARRLLRPGLGRHRPCLRARRRRGRARTSSRRPCTRSRSRCTASPASRSPSRSRASGRRPGSRPTGSGRRPTSSTSTSGTSRCRRSRRGSPCARPSTTCRRASSRRSTSTCALTRPRDRLEEVLEEVGQGARRGRVAAAGRADRTDPREPGAPPCARGPALRQRDRRVPRARPGRIRGHAGADRSHASSAPSSSSRRGADASTTSLYRGGRARGRRGPGGERRGARAHRDVRVRRGGAPAHDPRAPLSRDRAHRRGRRRRAGGAHPRAREDRPGERRGRDRDRGRGDARLGAAGRRAARFPALRSRRRDRGSGSTPAGSTGARRRRHRPGRVADGRRFFRARTPGLPRSWTSATPSSRVRRSACSRR